jgi:hypothetical protein
LGLIFSLPGAQAKADLPACVPVGIKLSSTASTASFFPLVTKNASPANTPTPRPLFVRVLELDGIDDFAFTPDHKSLDLGRGDQKDFTIEVYFYIKEGDIGLVTLLEREQFSLRLLLKSGTADGIQFIVQFESGDLLLFPVLNLESGWHHLAVFYDDEATPGKDVTGIYLDGALEATRTDPSWGLVQNSTRPLYLGNPTDDPFGGWIEEVRLSSTVRYTGSEFTIPERYFQPDEFTRALWHFDETPGSTSFADFSGNANRLTGINGATNIEPAD